MRCEHGCGGSPLYTHDKAEAVSRADVLVLRNLEQMQARHAHLTEMYEGALKKVTRGRPSLVAASRGLSRAS